MTIKKRTDIILPNRIGDSILTIPALLCLKQLKKALNNDESSTRIVCSKSMKSFFERLNLFETIALSRTSKIKSWLNTSEQAFFFLNSSQILGYKTKISYGQNIESKKYVKYNRHVPYLLDKDTERFADKNLLNLLQNKYKFSIVAINNFSLCLSLGYTYEQIRDVFSFESKYFSFDSEIFSDKKYLICCMEAAYGKKKMSSRRWNCENFFALAEHAFEKYGLETVFVGIDKEVEIPSRPYFIDYRAKVSIDGLYELIQNSYAYIGNDTGPLHMCNLAGKPTLGIYSLEAPEVYGPVFANNNYAILNPSSKEEVLMLMENMIDNHLCVNK